jgi:hypothetical protein
LEYLTVSIDCPRGSSICSPWRCRQHGHPNRWYPTTSLHDLSIVARDGLDDRGTILGREGKVSYHIMPLSSHWR